MSDILARSDLCTPWCLHVAVTLRIAEHLREGSRAAAVLAIECGADPDSLLRLLRHLAGAGVFAEPSPGLFALNDAARPLLEPAVRLSLDLDGFGGRMAHAWGSLLAAVRSGRPAYREVFGREFWDDLEANPEIARSFDALMGPAGHGVPDAEVLADPAGWDGVRSVVDVGGGTGALLAEVLRARPQVRGVLVDRPDVVAYSAATFAEAGVSGRVAAVGQSFFDPLPPGHDLYLLKNVLGDWPDGPALAILRRCAEALPPGGRVCILGSVTAQAAPSPELLMLVLVGGKQRTLEEFRTLAAEARLEVRATREQSYGRLLVECARLERSEQ